MAFDRLAGRKLHEALVAQGIPVVTVRVQNGVLQPVTVDPAQQAQADAIAASWPTVDTDTPNAASLRAKILNAIGTLETADNNWATLTAAQKDQALHLTVRVAAKLGRLVVSKLDSD